MLPMPAPCCHLLTRVLLPATLQPPHVVLVHGEANEMGRLKKVCWTGSQGVDIFQTKQ